MSFRYVIRRDELELLIKRVWKNLDEKSEEED